MPSLSLNHRELFFIDRRPNESNLTLLFVHGAASSHTVWPEALYDISGTRAVALDLPGHGRSSPPGRRTIDQYAIAVEEFITARNMENVLLVGHSMGSAIALTVASRAAMALRGLVLLGAGPRMPVHDKVLRGATNAPDEVAEFIATLGLGLPSMEIQEEIQRTVLAIDAMTLFGDFLACNRFDLRPNLHAIDIPALVIAGEQDRLTPLRLTESLVAGLPQAKFVTLAETGHYAMLERTAEVRSLIADFAAGLA